MLPGGLIPGLLLLLLLAPGLTLLVELLLFPALLLPVPAMPLSAAACSTGIDREGTTPVAVLVLVLPLLLLLAFRLSCD